VLTMLAWGQTERALIWLGQEPELARAAAAYVGVQRFSAVGFMLYGALSSYLVSRGIVRPGLVAILLANVFNACAAWALTFGSLGLPALGIRGLGLATSLTRIVLPCATAWLIVQFGLYKGAWTPWSRRVLDGPALRRQLLLGLPMGMTIALELGSFQAGTLIAGKLGAVSLGAHAIALNLSALFFMVPLGFSIGTSAHVGQLIGAELPERAQRAAHTALKLIAGYGLCAGAVFALGRHVLPALYTDDAPILAAAATVLPIAGAFQMVDGLQAAGSGILRGMGRPRITALVNLLGYFVIAMPFAYYTALHTSLGLRGIWLGYALGLSCTALGLVSHVLLRGPRTVKPL
jgi:MATE family multidrug resistance protein